MVLLQAELGDGQVNHALRVGDQTVPLDQQIEGRQDESHPGPKVVGLLVVVRLNAVDNYVRSMGRLRRQPKRQWLASRGRASRLFPFCLVA